MHRNCLCRQLLRFACAFGHQPQPPGKTVAAYSGNLQTSIQPELNEYFSNSGIVSSIALFELPQAGKTVSKRLSETSRKVCTPSFTAKGHTPPTLCPINEPTCSTVSIFAFVLKKSRYFLLSIFASPAITIKTGFSSTEKESVFAILQPWVFSAMAASSTVALDSASSSMRESIPDWAKYFFTFSKDIVLPSAVHYSEKQKVLHFTCLISRYSTNQKFLTAENMKNRRRKTLKIAIFRDRNCLKKLSLESTFMGDKNGIYE